VARFLAVLELYRRSALTFEQVEPLGELTLQWVAEDFGEEELAHLGNEWGGEKNDDD
jgi:segregation and condensation protein A